MKQTLRALLLWTLALLLLLAGAVPVSALFAPGWDNWSDGVEETWKTAYAAGETAIRAQNILGPINPHASREAKNLYAYLAVMSDSERFLTGTFDISTSDNVYNQVVREYGLEPALYSNRYIVDTTEPEMEVPTRHCLRAGLQLRVRVLNKQGWYFTGGSGHTGVQLSQPPTYPTHAGSKPNVKL